MKKSIFKAAKQHLEKKGKWMDLLDRYFWPAVVCFV